MTTCGEREVPDVGDPSGRPTGCRPGGCAGLCRQEGLAAADRAYRRRLLGRARLIVVDPDLAEEAVQDAFVRAWRACATFDPSSGPMLHWLFVITRNAAIDLARARDRRPPLSLLQARDVPADGISATDLVLLRTQLRDALAGLGAEHRHAVVETTLRDRSPADLAAELGIPAATVRTRVHYGLRRLRALLEAAEAAEAACPADAAEAA